MSHLPRFALSAFRRFATRAMRDLTRIATRPDHHALVTIGPFSYSPRDFTLALTASLAKDGPILFCDGIDVGNAEDIMLSEVGFQKMRQAP